MKRLLITMLFLTSLAAGHTQTYDFTGMRRSQTLNVNPIVQNQEVQGYYAFYKVDKVNSLQNEYRFEILDNNLTLTHSVDFIYDKNVILGSCQFNGQFFCMSMYDQKSRSVEYLFLDKKGVKAEHFNIARVDQSFDNSRKNVRSLGVRSVPNTGFIRSNTTRSNGIQTSLELFDNQGNSKWVLDIDGNGDKISYESFNISNVTEQYIIMTAHSRPKKYSGKDLKTSYLLIDTKTGKKITEFMLAESFRYLNPFDVSYDEKSDEIIVFGETYAKRKNGTINIKEKLGFFIQTFNSEGLFKNESYCTWEGDVSDLIPVNQKGRLEKNMAVMIQDIVRLDNGKLYVVGEQYRKAISAGGLALAALGGETAGIKVELHNMMIFEFSADLELEAVEIIEKKKTNILLPEGYGMVQADKLGLLLKSTGSFDYSFTTMTPEDDNFTVVYVNFDRKSSKGGSTVGYISLGEEDSIVSNTLTLKHKPTYWRVIPGKQGYLAVFEFHKKEKRGLVRLERLDI